MYNSFITLRTQTSIGKTSNLFRSENKSIQSATLGPTPESVKSSSLIISVFFSSYQLFILTLFELKICTVSYILLSLNPVPNSLYSSILTFFKFSIVGNV